MFCLLLALGLGALAWGLGADGRDAIASRETRDRTVRVIDHVRTATWWVAVAGAGLMLAAAGTARWWAGPRGRFSRLDLPPVPAPGWLWWLAAAVILLVAAWLRAERLNLSLYNDEAYMFRRYIAGDFRPDGETGQLVHRAPDWVTTVWHMEVGNNSPPYGLVARLNYEWVAERHGLAPAQVSETAIRWPAYAAGVAGLLVLGLLARGLGSPERGLLVLTVAALHPWMIRYASEGRGHGLLLLLVPLLLGAVWRALREGTWRWWLTVGGLSALMMWAFPGSVHPLLALNAILGIGWLLGWLRRREHRPRVKIQATRWLLANGLAALLFMLLFAPQVNQMRATMDEPPPSLQGAPPWSWWADIGSQLAIGMPWRDANPESPVASAVLRSIEAHNWLPVAALGLVALAVLLGWLWWCWHTRAGWLLAAVGFGAPLLAFAVARLTDTVLHPWYVLAALPALIVMAAGSLGWLMDIGGRIPRPAWWASAAVLAVWVAAIAPVVKRQTLHPLQPQREAVELARGGVYPGYLEQSDQVELAAFYTDFMVYDPFANPAWSVTELEAMEATARDSNRPLVVAFAHRRHARNSHGALLDYIESSGRYQLVADLQGTGHEQFNHFVYRWLGDRVSEQGPRPGDGSE